MKKLILTIAIVLTGIFSVNAQEQSGPADRMVNDYTNAAQLTPDQAAKIKPMLDNFITVRKTNKEKYANDANGLKAANKTNKENLKAQLKTVLTAEQIEKLDEYQKMKKERQEKANQQ
jgi:hypothetical protein